MTALLGLITALSVPLMILNMLGDVVSGIWLVFLARIIHESKTRSWDSLPNVL